MKIQSDNREFICDLILYFSSKKNIDIKNGKLLDFGCGAPKSLLLKKLKERGFCKNLFGVDVIPTQNINNSLSKINIQNIEPYQKIPFEEGFDLIICNQVFEHIEKIDIIFKQLSENLNKGGLIIAAFPTKEIILEPHIKLPLFHRIRKNSFLYNLYLEIACAFNLGSFSKFKNDPAGKKKNLEHRKVYMDKDIHYRSLKKYYKMLKVDFGSIEDISDYYCKYSRGKKGIVSIIKKVVSKIHPRSLRLWIIHRLFGIYLLIEDKNK